MNMRWIQAKETKLASEKTAIVRWYEHGEFQRIDLMSGHYLYDWAVKNKKELEDIEWLDESESSSPSHNDIVQEKADINECKTLWDLFIGFRDGKFYLQDCLNWVNHRKVTNEKLIEYIYEFAWHYGRLYHIGDAEKIKAAISEKFQLPEEFLSIPKLKQIGSESYWKKRCEQLTEALETVASKTNHIVLSYGGMNFNNPVANKIIDEVSAKVNEVCNYAIEQLKSSIGEETEGQDELWSEIFKELYVEIGDAEYPSVLAELKSKYTLIKKQ